MARDGIFFKIADGIHPKHRTPARALIFQGALASVLALSGTFEELTNLFIFAGWIFYGLAVVRCFDCAGRNRKWSGRTAAGVSVDSRCFRSGRAGAHSESLAGSAGSLDDWIVTELAGCRFTGGGRGEPPTRKLVLCPENTVQKCRVFRAKAQFAPRALRRAEAPAS